MNGVDRAVHNSPPACPDLDQEEPHPDELAMGVAPRTAAERKNIPLARGLLDYFPLALMAVAELSRIGNEQHNPGEPIHWARDKSTDHADCVMRHLIDRGKFDVDQVRHTTKVAWRALALLQTELENAQPAKEAWATFGEQMASRAPVRVEWGEPARSRLADDPQGFGR